MLGNIKKQKRSKNHGTITVDFIFALVLVAGLSSVLFSMSLTLTVVSITQYMTFAAARNLEASHLDSATQGNMSHTKFESLQKAPELAPLFGGGWFELQNAQFYGKPGDLQKYRPEFHYKGQGPNSPDLFVGFVVTLVARILDFQVPFFGSTTDNDDGSGSGFTTEVGSFLSKEPSVRQCIRFNRARWRAIRKLNVGSGYADYSSGTPENTYFPIGDNGC